MLIFASVMDVPMAGIAYDPKIKGFMDYMKQENYIELEEFSKDAFLRIAENVIDNSEELRNKLREESAVLREKALQNACFAAELLKKGKDEGGRR